MATLANVTLTIHKAAGLVGLNPGGTSNPVVTASIGTQSASTPVVSKSTNPVFTDATFHFQSCPLPTVLTLKVLNRMPFVDIEDLLGTATITLFDATTEQVSKTIPLSHGGNAALAHKAGEKGCGTVSIAYEVVETAASPVNATAHGAFPISGSVSTPRPEPTPMAIPAAHSISGPHAAQPPALGASMSSSSSSSSASTAADRGAGLSPSNPSTTNPAACNPKGTPSSTAPALLPSHLTPPSVGPARVPASLGFLVADSAAAAPSAEVSITANQSGMPGFVSYPVPGLRAPDAATTTTTTTTAAAAPSGDLFVFAQNDVSGSAALPPGPAQPPSNAPVPLLPVANSMPQAHRYTPGSVHDAAAAARSSSLTTSAVTHTPSSSLFTSAAAAPVAQRQQLLVIPPNIEGTPMLNSNNNSIVSSHSSSHPASTVLFVPQPSVSLAPCFPTSTTEASSALAERHMNTLASSRPASASAAVVAVAPTPAPWTNYRSSRPDTPKDDSFPLPQRLTHSSAIRPLSCPMPRGVTRPRSGEDLLATEAAARSCSKNRSELAAAGASGEGTVGSKADAQRLYADPHYLFESAATGHDLGVFQKLRKADPFLSYGFLDCRDYAGRTLLHVAAWNGQLAVMEILLSSEAASHADVPLSRGAEEEVLGDKGRLLRGSLLLNLLSSQGGNSILHAAAMGGRKEVLTWIMQSSNREYLQLKNQRNERGQTPAEAAKECGFTDIAMMLA